MARKEAHLTIDDRGNELAFKIREMPALQLERWIMRAFLLAAGSGVQTPDGAGLKEAGLFLASQGLSALASVDFEKAQPLLDELLGCCFIVIGRLEKRLTPEMVDDHVKDVRTLLKLRFEALKLNLSFLAEGAAAGSSFRESGNGSGPSADEGSRSART